MPGTYGTHALPLVIGSDRPCDIPTTLCALRDRVNTFLDGYQSTLDTVVNTVPAARLVRTTAYANAAPPEGNVLMPFTGVEFDNANMTNLSSDARVITAPTLGRYWITAYIEVATRSGATVFDQEAISIEGGLFNSTTPRNELTIHAPGGNNPGMGLHVTELRGAFPGQTFAMRLHPEITFGTAAISIVRAELSVFWHSDF